MTKNTIATVTQVKAVLKSFGEANYLAVFTNYLNGNFANCDNSLVWYELPKEWFIQLLKELETSGEPLSDITNAVNVFCLALCKMSVRRLKCIERVMNGSCWQHITSYKIRDVRSKDKNFGFEAEKILQVLLKDGVHGSQHEDNNLKIDVKSKYGDYQCKASTAYENASFSTVNI